jgi:hypothetical protein
MPGTWHIYPSGNLLKLFRKVSPVGLVFLQAVCRNLDHFTQCNREAIKELTPLSETEVDTIFCNLGKPLSYAIADVRVTQARNSGDSKGDK